MGYGELNVRWFKYSVYSSMELKTIVINNDLLSPLDLDKLPHNSSSLLDNSGHVHLVGLEQILHLSLVDGAHSCTLACWLSNVRCHVRVFVAVQQRLVRLNELLEDRLCLLFIAHI